MRVKERKISRRHDDSADDPRTRRQSRPIGATRRKWADAAGEPNHPVPDVDLSLAHAPRGEASQPPPPDMALAWQPRKKRTRVSEAGQPVDVTSHQPKKQRNAALTFEQQRALRLIEAEIDANDPGIADLVPEDAED